MPNVPYPYKVNGKLVTGNWFLNTNLFLIKPFLIVKFDCTKFFFQKKGTLFKGGHYSREDII